MDNTVTLTRNFNGREFVALASFCETRSGWIVTYAEDGKPIPGPEGIFDQVPYAEMMIQMANFVQKHIDPETIVCFYR